MLIFNVTGNRDVTVFFNLLGRCEFDIVLFTPNVGTENDRAGKYFQVISACGATGDFKLLKCHFLENDSANLILYKFILVCGY